MRIYKLSFALLAMHFLLTMAAEAQTIHCAPGNGGKTYCQADTRHGVRLAKQRSEAPCKQNDSWGYDEQAIWVDHGCDGDFALGAEASTGGEVKLLTCSSDGGKKYCDANTRRGVRLVKQLSDDSCKQGDSWGYDGLGIWVDKGCSADFALGGGAQPGASSSGDEGASKTPKERTCLQEVGKQRSDQLVKQCLRVSPATHPPCNAENSCELIKDEIRRSCGLLGRDAPAFCGGYK